MKQCIRCEETKPFDQFYDQPLHGDGLHSWCKTCHLAAGKASRRANPESVRKSRLANREINRDKFIKNMYGLGAEGWDAMFDAQNGVCLICGEPETKVHKNGRVYRLAVDHCHVTGIVRGLLCNNCNRGLGHFRDTPELLERAAAYLRSW